MKKFLTVSFLLIHIVLVAQRPLPELWGLHIHDEAGVLSQPVIDQLENQLKVYGDSTSNQIAILIIPSLDGEVLEEYSLKVSEKWKLGQAKKDNGVLLLIAIDDHKMRIEVGQGLEGVLTDAICNRIIRNEMAPAFRQNNYTLGVQSAIDSIIKAIGGEYIADDTDAAGDGAQPLGLVEKIIFSIFIYGVLGIFAFIGVIIPDKAGWFVYFFLIPFYASFPLIALGVTYGLIGLGGYLVLFPLVRLLLPKTAVGKKLNRVFKSGGKNGTGGANSSSSGWSSSSSSWSSGSSGSSFSGGGGSFSGGGSSGSW